MIPNLGSNIRKLQWQLGVTGLGFLLVVWLGILTVVDRQYMAIAQTAADQARDRILRGDEREAVADIYRGTGGVFQEIRYDSSHSGQRLFMPATREFADNSRGERAIVIPISFENGTDHAGTISFRYSLIEVLVPMGLASFLVAAIWIGLFRGFKRGVILRHHEMIAAENLRIRAELAAQVAHDIRAPLAALTVLEGEIGVLPENTRVLLKTAMDRIQGIAKSLLDSQRSEIESRTLAAELTDLTPLIESSLNEAKLRFRSRPEIELQLEFSAPHELRARIESMEFVRVLSNLIGNACEAISESGTVTVRAGMDEDSAIVIEIADTGKGIPAEILARLGQRGATFGKSGGTGLGLYHARTTVESWGGSLEIQSTEGQGTTVSLRLLGQEQ